MAWQWLLRSWLTAQARERLHAAAAEAARKRAGAPDDDQSKVSVDVAIIFALAIEAGGFEDRLEDVVTQRAAGFVVRRGRLGERAIMLVESGAGPAAARRAAEAVIQGHRPRWLISAGFCGGLTPKLRRGDIVLANAVTDSSGKGLSIDLKIASQEVERQPSLHIGTLLTVDWVVSEPAEKQSLGAKHGALAVDMESTVVGDVCRREKVRFLAARVVSDAMDDRLPDDIGRLLTQKSSAGRAGAVLGSLARRPASIKDLWRLKEQAMRASERLATFLAGMIAQLEHSDASTESE